LNRPDKVGTQSSLQRLVWMRQIATSALGLEESLTGY
jgi:hypothetical protein